MKPMPAKEGVSTTLTKDHIKPVFRKDRVYPRSIKPQDETALQLAEDLLFLFTGALDQSFGSLSDMAGQLPSDRFKTRQAFWKIACDACKWLEPDQKSLTEHR